MWTISKWTKTADELARLLEHWDGAKAEVWEYSATHSQLLIRFFREGNPMASMYLLCKDCRESHFFSYWLNMQVRVQLTSDGGNHSHIVSDGNRLRVECGGVFATESDKLISERPVNLSLSASNSVKEIFARLVPGNYQLRVVYDRNNNGKQETGDVIRRLQPENVFVSGKVIKILADWESEEDIRVPSEDKNE